MSSLLQYFIPAQFSSLIGRFFWRKSFYLNFPYGIPQKLRSFQSWGELRRNLNMHRLLMRSIYSLHHADKFARLSFEGVHIPLSIKFI